MQHKHAGRNCKTFKTGFFWQNVLWSGVRARSLNQHKRGWNGGGKGLEVTSRLCWRPLGQYLRLASSMTQSKASSEDLTDVTSCPVRFGPTTWTGQSLLKSLLLDSTFRNRKEGREEIRQELKPVKTTLFPHKCHLSIYRYWQRSRARRASHGVHVGEEHGACYFQRQQWCPSCWTWCVTSDSHTGGCP